MAYRFEFDSANRILLLRFEGPLTNESLVEAYNAIRKYSNATDAKAGIWDFSSVTEVNVTSDVVRSLAKREPAMPDATILPRIVVAPAAHVFGIARMFQLVGESTRPLLTVVRGMDEALTALAVQSPHFEPLE